MPRKTAPTKPDPTRKLKYLDNEIDHLFTCLTNGEPPKVWYIHPDRTHPINEFAFEPKRFNVFCAEPGVGKTSFVHTLVFDAMRLNEDLKILEINCDTPFQTIIERELSRQTGISNTSIHLKGFDQGEAGFTEDQWKHLNVAKNAIKEIAGRYMFLGSDATFSDAVAVIDKHRPNVFIVDYVQIMNLETGSLGMEKMAEFCRQCKFLKDKYDLCILGIAAATKDSFGKPITLSSIRDSSELAYIPDDCVVINRSPTDKNVLIFSFEKRRNGDSKKIVEFEFDGERQTFKPLTDDAINDGNDKNKK